MTRLKAWNCKEEEEVIARDTFKNPKTQKSESMQHYKLHT